MGLLYRNVLGLWCFCIVGGELNQNRVGVYSVIFFEFDGASAALPPFLHGGVPSSSSSSATHQKVEELREDQMCCNRGSLQMKSDQNFP